MLKMQGIGVSHSSLYFIYILGAPETFLGLEIPLLVVKHA